MFDILFDMTLRWAAWEKADWEVSASRCCVLLQHLYHLLSPDIAHILIGPVFHHRKTIQARTVSWRRWFHFLLKSHLITIICEILCLCNCHFPIVTTKDSVWSRVLDESSSVCLQRTMQLKNIGWSSPHVSGLQRFRNRLGLGDYLVCAWPYLGPPPTGSLALLQTESTGIDEIWLAHVEYNNKKFT